MCCWRLGFITTYVVTYHNIQSLGKNSYVAWSNKILWILTHFVFFLCLLFPQYMGPLCKTLPSQWRAGSKPQFFSSYRSWCTSTMPAEIRIHNADRCIENAAVMNVGNYFHILFIPSVNLYLCCLSAFSREATWLHPKFSDHRFKIKLKTASWRWIHHNLLCGYGSIGSVTAVKDIDKEPSSRHSWGWCHTAKAAWCCS